ncbi:hypothetical protein A4A49_65890 [Nicotiana attenuata]|uniref:Uncharacterized protein n=1 Tax=Nicotiana attenuata TaxID=49451 RepID=A0A1J6KCG9_NICAT|nr:hypothetical protein A4A49_65890 [Nicotiana attenuata]
MVAEKIILTFTMKIQSLKLKINREKHNKWKNREQDSKSWNFIFLERTALKFSPGDRVKEEATNSSLQYSTKEFCGKDQEEEE